MYFLVFETENSENHEIVNAEEIEKAVKTFSISFISHYKYTIKYPYILRVSAVKLEEKQKVMNFKVKFPKIDKEPLCEQ